jgi:hypothetical protein
MTVATEKKHGVSFEEVQTAGHHETARIFTFSQSRWSKFGAKICAEK